MKKKIKKSNLSKEIIIIIVFSILSILFFSFYFINSNKDYSSYKYYSDKDYVLDGGSITNNTTKVKTVIPYLNIKGEVADTINKNINEVYDFVLLQSGYECNYEYFVNKDIISIVIKARYSEKYNTLYETYKYYTYNYDINDDKLISDEELLKRYNINSEQVKNFLENKYLNFYYVLLDKKVIDSDEYSFSEFLEVKMIDNVLDDVSYSVEKDGDLVVYRPFVINSYNNEYKYFSEKDFRFILLDK